MEVVCDLLSPMDRNSFTATGKALIALIGVCLPVRVAPIDTLISIYPFTKDTFCPSLEEPIGLFTDKELSHLKHIYLSSPSYSTLKFYFRQ